ncbi:MAG: leucyl aminopeptidase [Holosporales bacterium]|jgi:leucyl aminopeptidase|nr:leucyl aminopeptidase [Holosporales bacterium]
MEINFYAPSSSILGIVIGSSNGAILSSSTIFASNEREFLKQKFEKLRKDSTKNVIFQSFLHQYGNNSAVIMQVADLVKTEISETEAQEIGAQIFVAAESIGEEEVVVDFSQNFSPGLVAHIAAGFKIRSFRFDKYKTEKQKHITINKAYFISSNQQLTEIAYKDISVVCNAVNFARTLSSEAPNVLYPEAMANEAKSLKRYGLKVDLFDEKDLTKFGMNALLGVAQGSVHSPYLAVCQWNGSDRSEPPIALVGKGVTFDSGGISIKPSHDMHEMKEDMTGAAVVLATMQMAAQLNLPINLVGAIGLVENMPSGTAQRPSDIVQSMSGKTIEIQNTDAEGRLVLADVLHYTETEFSPKCIIDFATLTGAIQVALGQEFAGLFSNNNTLSKKLRKAGILVQEKLWELPLDPAYDKDIDSNIADVKNVGSGRGAGSITAAQFLQRFISPETPWAHIDIAAVSHDKKERALTGAGFTGFGVRLMYAFLRDSTTTSFNT